MKPPTRRQAECLAILRDAHARGCPPTLREIGDQMGIRSANGVTEILQRLERRGLVEHRAGCRSRMAWVPLGDDMVPRLLALAEQADARGSETYSSVASVLRECAARLNRDDG